MLPNLDAKNIQVSDDAVAEKSRVQLRMSAATAFEAVSLMIHDDLGYDRLTDLFGETIEAVFKVQENISYELHSYIASKRHSYTLMKLKSIA